MAEVKTIDQVIRSISKDFGNIVHKGIPKNEEDKSKLISLGSISLDFCVYGGLKEGTITEFSGPEGSGKTTMACLAAGSYQKTYPEKSVLFVDIEGTFDWTWGEKLGLKTDTQFIYYECVGQSGESILNHVVDFIRTGQVGFVIIDSIPLLIPNYVQDADDLEQKSMGGNAKLLSDFTARYIGLIRKQKVIVVGINQVRENMSGYGDPLITTGGRAWKHACSLRLMFKRGDFFDQNGDKVKKKDAQSPAGHYIEMYVLKNKNSPWDRKLGFSKLHYWKGIDYISDLTEVAVYFGLIDNSSVGWFKILDEEGKPVLDDEGKEIKINGKLKLAEYLRTHKDVSGRLYHKVKDLMANKEPGYIEGFEALLGVSTDFITYGSEDKDPEIKEEDNSDE